ncbi:MAG: hypothetical protein R3250_08995 [Melioribacteraceae bacterium]|nr:hypothetical protein [Melioribacteraceae bacterium]
MGQQQLLLIVLSVIIVGIAITLGITLFSANAIEQKRNEVINECALLASEAQLYYRRPVTLGGGGKSFLGWEIPQEYQTTVAGSFSLSAAVTSDEVIITGTGNEEVTAGDSIKVEMRVTPLSYQTTIIN